MVLQYTRPKMCEVCLVYVMYVLLVYRNTYILLTIPFLYITCSQTQCGAYGIEALPRGIISETSDLEMRPLWGLQNKKVSSFIANINGIIDPLVVPHSPCITNFPVVQFVF